MSRNTEATDDVKTWTGGPLNYKEGFFTQLATDELAKGINEEVVRAISAKRNEPEWMLEVESAQNGEPEQGNMLRATQ